MMHAMVMLAWIRGRCTERFQLQFWVDAGMPHNVCRSGMIGISKWEFGENFNDNTPVDYEPLYSDKDTRFIQDRSVDNASKLKPLTAKGKKFMVLIFLFLATQKIASFIIQLLKDIHKASTSTNSVEILVLIYLKKLVVILLPVLLVFFEWVVLELLMLSMNPRHSSLIQAEFCAVRRPTKKLKSTALKEAQISALTGYFRFMKAWIMKV